MLLDYIFIAIVYCFLFNRWKKQGTVNLVHKTLFFIYLICVVRLTLMPIISSIPHIFNHPFSYNFNIFSDVIFKRGDFERQILLNIIMTIPLGFCLRWIYKKNFLETFLIILLVVFCIELVQPVLHAERIGDITDMFTNSVGGIIGYITALWVVPLTVKVAYSKKH